MIKDLTGKKVRLSIIEVKLAEKVEEKKKIEKSFTEEPGAEGF